MPLTESKPLPASTAPADFAAARRHMVTSQLEPNQITDPALIAAMAAIPREDFVPEMVRGVAYLDNDIAVAADRSMMEPMVLGRLLQEAEILPTETALDVGTGTGYGAAVLARLLGRVVALECDVDLARRAEAALAADGQGRAEVVIGPLEQGHAAAGPYDVILLESAVEVIPQSLLDQLAGGGRLLVVMRAGPGLGKATLVQRIGDVFSQRPLFDAATPKFPARLAAFRRPARFAF